MIFSIDDPARRQQIALIDANTQESWTYHKLANEIARRCDWLSSTTKNLLFIFCRNDFTSVAWYLAAVESGNTAVLLDERIDAELAKELISLYRPEWLVNRIGPDLAIYEPATDGELWQRRRADQAPINPELTLLLSTSGSTGSPKLVRLRRSNLEANANSIRQALAIEASDIPIAHLPISYSYGLSIVNSHLAAGAAVVLTQASLLSPAFWDAVRRYEVNSFSGVPYTYQMLRRLGLESLRVPALRIMTQAGGKLDDPTIAHFNGQMTQRGGRFYVMYGQTEATARIAILPAGDLPRKAGSAGRAIPGGRMTVHDGDGSQINEPDCEGELVYSGPNVMLGYANSREDLAKGDELGGRLFTGDRARLDSEGYVYILGRAKRDAKLFGLRVNLDELEAMVKRSGPAAAVACTDQVIFFCEFGTEEIHHKLRATLSERLKINRSAFVFKRVDKLPPRDSGKIDYDQLMTQI
jgi:acyl-coenzyme A synthetase/AMP-(fatty) acid ligase